MAKKSHTNWLISTQKTFAFLITLRMSWISPQQSSSTVLDLYEQFWLSLPLSLSLSKEKRHQNNFNMFECKVCRREARKKNIANAKMKEKTFSCDSNQHQTMIRSGFIFFCCCFFTFLSKLAITWKKNAKHKLTTTATAATAAIGAVSF